MDTTFALNDYNRRISNLVRIGIVKHIDVENLRARVEITPGLLTSWLPWLTPRAGAVQELWGLEEGEQVIVISPMGDLSQGVIMGALYKENPVRENAESLKTLHQVKYGEEALLSYKVEQGTPQFVLELHNSKKEVLVRIGADSKKGITIDTTEELPITINSNSEINLKAKNKLVLDCGKSKLELSAEGINIDAKEVKIAVESKVEIV